MEMNPISAIAILGCMPGILTENLTEGNQLKRHLLGDALFLASLLTPRLNTLPGIACRHLPANGE